ncbi:MAG: BatA domain-containing protein, partial [Candidatus Marinimicrobia bacterium]|nr:BatA domain-containing protein [Candidatus Neomarinimicrobiota bacterium]
MIFLQPLLLTLGVLIGIPFIIHFLGERKYQALSFSSLKFLREIEHDSLQKLQLRQWLVLVSRALWISMLVFTLAQPFFSRGRGSLEPGIMIIDKSFSTRLDEKFRVAEESLKKKFPRWDIVAYNERTNLDSLREQVHQ